MPSAINIEIISIADVPPDLTPDRDNVEVDGLVALLVDDGQVSMQSPHALRHEAVGFEVQGLPAGYKAWIMEKEGKCQLMLSMRDGDTEWLGEYPSVRDALLALSIRKWNGTS